MPVCPSCLRSSFLVFGDGSAPTLGILQIYLQKQNCQLVHCFTRANGRLHQISIIQRPGWLADAQSERSSHTIPDGVWLKLLVGAGLAHSQRRRVSDPTVRDWRATILQQIKVVGHGCRMAHDPRIHSKPILVSRPRQLTKKESIR